MTLFFAWIMILIFIVLNGKYAYFYMRNCDRIDTLKEIFPEVLRRAMGNVSLACKELNVSRQWYYNNLKHDPDFQLAVEDINEHVIDFVESRLLNQIKNDNTQATVFFLKTRARHRGYIDRSEFIASRPSDDAIDVNPTKEQRDEIVRLVNES